MSDYLYSAFPDLEKAYQAGLAATRDAAPRVDAIQLANAIASLCRSYIQVEGDAWACGANDMAVKVLELIAASAREKT